MIKCSLSMNKKGKPSVKRPKPRNTPPGGLHLTISLKL